VLAGWRLFSDEFALVDIVSGEIVPAPRPVSLKEAAIDIIRRRDPGVVFSRGGIDVEQQRFVHMRPPADSVRRALERATPGAIVTPKYTSGAATTIEPLPKARTLITLTGQSFNYTLMGADGFRTLARLAGACDGYRLEYSDLDDVLPKLAELTS
jgi:HprK-related kinase A